jgi:CheY-like chemotaxis protein
VVLSAHSSSEDVHQALAAGCRCFETKPIVLKKLLERINEILKASGADSNP